jgi:hypothetical protein
MLTFTQLLEELAQKEITLYPAEVQRMKDRFGDKTLQMGHLQEDGSMTIPVDCVLEAVQSIGSQTLSEAVETLKDEQMVSMLESAESLVERVGQARERRLREMIGKFQSEPDDTKAHQQWKQIEKEVFGVDFRD